MLFPKKAVTLACFPSFGHFLCLSGITTQWKKKQKLNYLLSVCLGQIRIGQKKILTPFSDSFVLWHTAFFLLKGMEKTFLDKSAFFLQPFFWYNYLYRAYYPDLWGNMLRQHCFLNKDKETQHTKLSNTHTCTHKCILKITWMSLSLGIWCPGMI